MLINLSNHPLNQGKSSQIRAGESVYKRVVVIPFSNIELNASEEEALNPAPEYVNRCYNILSKCQDQNNPVHLINELTFTLAVAYGFIRENIKRIALITNRIVEEDNIKKIIIFNFIRFREYKIL